MVHLIDKDAVLAEIDELSSAIKIQLDHKKGDAFWIAQKLLLERLRTKVNTLEVKEVDLNKEIDKYTSDNYYGSETLGFFANRTDNEPDGVDIVLCAKHFFKLGLSASNPLTYEDIEMIGKLRLRVALDLRNKELESSINNPIKFTEDDLCKEVLKRFKAQKGEKV